MAAVLCVIALSWQFCERHREEQFRLDPLSALLLGMVLFTLGQWLAGVVHFKGHFAMALAYFGGAALTLVVGRDWAQRNPEQFGNFIFLAFVVAAFATSFLLLVQWLQLWQWMGIWIQELPSYSQPYGNLNQPNNAATLLVLGVVGLSWFSYSGKAGLGVWLVGSAYLAFFLAMTGSRIGYLSFTILLLMAIAIGWREGRLPASWRKALWLLFVVFVIWMIFINSGWGLGSELRLTQSPKAFERDLTSIRIYLWKAYAHAALSHPWVGYGFEQGFNTQVAAGQLGYRLNGLYTWSHNALLDVATWFGLPMAGVTLWLVSWIVWKLARTPSTSPRWLYTSAIFAIVLHGMVELPLAFAYFLFPVCLMTGAILGSLHLPSLEMPRKLVAVGTLAMSGLLATLVYDYFRVEAAFYTWRFAHANIGRDHPMDIPDVLLLDQFHALLTGLRGTATTLTEQEVNDFEKAVVHDPSAAAMQHLAEIRVRRGDVLGAQRAADMASLTSQPRTRRALAARWRFLALQNRDFEAVHWDE